jgi:hypothetical protein
MRMHLSHRPTESGSALVAVLMAAGVIGISLASYLSLTANQNRASMRSEYFNSVMPIAEAGIEEGMTQLNHTNVLTGDSWTSYSGGYTFSNGLTAAGQQYVKSRSFSGGAYTVTISSGSAPVLISQAALSPPLGTNVIYRTVRVNTAALPLFAKGMVAKASVDWVGNIMSDSFDSLDPAYSTNGRYDAAKRRDNGSIGAVSGSISMGGGILYGNSYTGPAGNVSNGTVGTSSWISGGGAGIQPGHYANNLNVSFPEVAPPWDSSAGGAWTPLGGYATVTNSLGVASTNLYTHILDTGDYQLSSIPNGVNMLVRGDARLYVTGDIDMRGQSQITIGSAGSLKVYVAGDCNLSGNGVMNTASDALKFSVYGLPTCTSVRFNGNASFTGTVYAPQAAFSAGGGGNNNYDCVGSIIANSVSMNGNFTFHYDENLGRNGPRAMFVVTDWNEI